MFFEGAKNTHSCDVRNVRPRVLSSRKPGAHDVFPESKKKVSLCHHPCTIVCTAHPPPHGLPESIGLSYWPCAYLSVPLQRTEELTTVSHANRARGSDHFTNQCLRTFKLSAIAWASAHGSRARIWNGQRNVHEAGQWKQGGGAPGGMQRCGSMLLSELRLQYNCRYDCIQFVRPVQIADTIVRPVQVADTIVCP